MPANFCILHRLARYFAPGLMFVAMMLAMPAAFAQTICAIVKIEIRQELTFERQAFEARLRISNELDSLAVENLRVDVQFEDENGGTVLVSSDPDSNDAAFFIRVWSMDGVDAVDGTGVVAPASTADVRWLIVPAPGSGGGAPSGTLYYVGARVSYTLGGETMESEVAPDFIFVRPLPLLTLDYFLTKDVFADDPLTPQVEPIEPFTLGVRVRNNGDGPASQVNIESAQPEIVENDQGLLIDFRITGSSVDEQPVEPSLLVKLGDIEPGAAATARWVMETTLSGQFIDFQAEFSHADEFGGSLTSIIDAANTHFLIRDVLVDLPGRDAVRDFLALDGDVKRVYESSGLDTPVTDQSEFANLLTEANGRQTIQFPETAGFVYVQLPDPYSGTKEIVEAFRSDGKTMRLDNVWFSRERNRNTNSWEYYLNLFDANSTGRYVLALEDVSASPSPPALQFIADRQVREGDRIQFIVEASDPNGTVPTISAEPLPAGAELVNETTGQVATYGFDWTVGAGQALTDTDGTYLPYELTFTASDGVLSTSQIVQILVCPEWDSDCDRMADAWELARFGTLSRDSLSDLEEYLETREVGISLEPGINLFAYPHQVPPEHATCIDLLVAMGATGPLDTLSRFDSTLTPSESCTLAGGDDFPIQFGEGYIVRMTAPSDFLLEGDPLCAGPDITAGVTLRGHPFPEDDLTCYAWLEQFNPAELRSIERYDVTTGRFEGCAYLGEGADATIAGKDFPIERGEGYLLSSRFDGALRFDSCR